MSRTSMLSTRSGLPIGSPPPGAGTSWAAPPSSNSSAQHSTVQHVPGPHHRAALEVCAHVRVTTEAILREALARADAHDLFEWLRGLSFVEQGPFGLFPHDLAREAIDADFRWRDPEPQMLVLSQPEFADAARDALRDYHRPAALATNPLLRSRLVVERGEAEPGPATLQSLLREAAETLRATPKEQKLYRALWRTYFEPAATQELAAENLGLPFSTYRYHLTKGTERIVEWLWQRELHGFQS